MQTVFYTVNYHHWCARTNQLNQYMHFIDMLQQCVVVWPRCTMYVCRNYNLHKNETWYDTVNPFERNRANGGQSRFRFPARKIQLHKLKEIINYSVASSQCTFNTMPLFLLLLLLFFVRPLSIQFIANTIVQNNETHVSISIEQTNKQSYKYACT